MSRTQESILAEFDLLKGDDWASIDPTPLYAGEAARLEITKEATGKERTPLFILLPFIIRQLERPEVTGVIIDGTGTHFEVYAQVEPEGSEQTSVEIFPAQVIAETGNIPADQIKTNIGLYLKAYYLLRYYLLGGSLKYAVTKLEEGFTVFANDPEHAHVWAKHKVM